METQYILLLTRHKQSSILFIMWSSSLVIKHSSLLCLCKNICDELISNKTCNDCTILIYLLITNLFIEITRKMRTNESWNFIIYIHLFILPCFVLFCFCFLFFCCRGAKCTEIWSEKAPDLSHLGPIWPTLEPNLASLWHIQNVLV